MTPLQRYVVIFALTAPASVATWLVFHSVFVNLSRTEAVVGYVDPVTQMGIDLGYLAMIAGTAVFGAIALWAAVQALRLRFSGKP